jgi:hypothetical protein
MMKNTFTTVLCATVFALASAVAADAASYNFDFTDKFGAPSSSFAAAGVAGIWNVTSRVSATATGFTDVTGANGGVSVSITAGVLDGFTVSAATDVLALLNDNFYTESGSWALEVSGLLDGVYDAYLYAPAHSEVALGQGAANGAAFSSISGGATLVEGVSYTVLTGITVTGGLFNASATSIGTGFSYAGLAGLQLVGPVADVPVPAAGLLMLTGLGALGLARRRRKA